MPRKNTILRRITIILLALLSPAFAMAQDPDPSPDPEPQPKVLPYSYGFESSLATDGWTLTNPDGSLITAEISNTNPHIGTYCFSFSAADVDDPANYKTACLISPELSVTEASRMLFYFRKLDATSGTFKIGTSTSGTDDANFLWTEITSATTAFAPYIFEIPNGVKYIAFKFESGATANSLLLDDITVASARSARFLPYSYGFEKPIASSGWTIVNEDKDGEDNYYISAEISSTSVWNGSKSFVFSTSEATTHAAYLISPELNVIEASRLLFYFRKLDAAHSSSFRIGTSIIDADPAHFTWSNAITTATTDFNAHVFEIALTSPSVKYIAFKFESGAANSLVIDDIMISPATCHNATAFRRTQDNRTSVLLEWNDNSYGYATYKIKNGEEEIATLGRGETSYTYTGLTQNTEYTLKLYTVCDETETESATLNFTTGNGSRVSETLQGPVVDGYVCGGGRMADVEGSSRVTVVNCNHLYAVYGGNDIAGEVKAQTSHYTGDDAFKGAEVILGTNNTERVFVDYVYGGGSGLYYYQTSIDGVNDIKIGTETTSLTDITTGENQTGIQEITYVDGTPLDPRINDNPRDPRTNDDCKYNRIINQDTSLKVMDQIFTENGNINTNVTVTVKGFYEATSTDLIRTNKFATITAIGGHYPSFPKVDHTRIFVNSDNVYIDSLFGGAENAQVGKDVVNPSDPADTSVSITINKGTVYAVFGGNNYGGFLGKGTYQHIVVNDTKKNDSSSLNLGGDDATGKSHSKIGNTYSVFSSNNVEAHGIRYLFGGGNIITGRNVHIEVNGGQIDTLFAGGNSADVASTKVDVNVTTPLYNLGNSPYTSLVPYNPSTSAFDIRCLFGGNNDANMYSVPTLNITKGGIHNLYGGGNNGLMLGSEAYADNNELYSHDTANNPPALENLSRRSTKISINNANVVIDTIYGGGQSAGTLHDTYLALSNGTIGTVFGGTNIQGNIGYQGNDGLGRTAAGKEYAKTNILIEKNVSIKGDVFGGSNGYYRCPNPNNIFQYGEDSLFRDGTLYENLIGESLPMVWQTNLWMRDSVYNDDDAILPNLSGNVYGGGNMSPIGALQGGNVTLQSEGNTEILITGGQMDNTTKGVYGGGNYANVYGNATIKMIGDKNGDFPWIATPIYGGNDKAGTVTGGPGRSRITPNSTEALNYANIAWETLPDYMRITEGNNDLSSTHKVALNSSNAASYILVQGYVSASRIYGGGNGLYNYYRWDDEGHSVGVSEGEDGAPDAFFNSDAGFIYPDQRNSFIDINVDQKNDDKTIGLVFGGGNRSTVGADITIGSTTLEKGYPTVWLNSKKTYTKYPDIDYLFGGNNRADMNVVPRIYLLKGSAWEVFAGGNQGIMRDNATLFNQYDHGFSTCVMMISGDVDIQNSIFGGSNVADVLYSTYVGIKRGTVNASIYGGNNISGNVSDSHIDISGSQSNRITVNGEVFGGGKGEYTYGTENLSTSSMYVVKWSTNVGDFFYSVASRPYTETTHVKITNSELTESSQTAVTMHGNIYGGGLAGGCRLTDVDIDAPNGIFDCMIFGGGKGYISQIGDSNSSFDGYQNFAGQGHTRRHAGNIVSQNSLPASTNVHLRQMKNMSLGNGKRHAVFGGGYSGDVSGNTNVTLYNTNTAQIPAVYLGGMASDVTGLAKGLFDGGTLTDNLANNVDTIYGGNDFNGKVQATEITINSGFYQHVFGAGNGDYNYKNLLASKGFATLDTTPYSMDVMVTYNGGTFRDNVYGGGNLGLVGYRGMDPDDMEADDADRYDKLGRIHVVINDGQFKHHVFGGARGKGKMSGRFFGTASGTRNNVDNAPLGKQLVYGLKQIDMYGGKVFFSLLGGSESVDDGTPYECRGPVDANTNFYKPLDNRTCYTSANANSTLRPSSIVNIIGGHIRKSLYGGGYQGNIYGSVYVNIGKEAVDDSPVWSDFGTTTVFKEGSTSYNLASMKPTLPTTLTTPVILEASVYNCADWGEAQDNAYFNTRGVFGGQTNIIIDGEGYNTTGYAYSATGEPEMDIAFNIVGAGTSTEGGDINRLIIMRNYGNYICPKPKKNLYSIQRADKVVLENVYLTIHGEQDAFESYASPNYSLNRIDTLVLCNDNILSLESASKFIGLHASMKDFPSYPMNIYKLYNIDGNSPNLVTNVPQHTNGAANNIATTSENVVSDDILDNQVEGDCTENGRGCQDLDICALVPTNRGDAGRPGKYNTIILDEGSYMSISPFIDISDMTSGSPVAGRRDGIDDNEDAVSTNDHDFGHIFGYTYLAAPLETMAYVFGIDKQTGDNPLNHLDGGFVSPCTCNNIGTYANEIDYTRVSGGDHPYRSWRIGSPQGLRKRSATLIANKDPDNMLNFPLSNVNPYKRSLNNATQSATADFTLPDSYFAYATTAIELPPAKKGNFYIVETIEIDQESGGEMRLIDEGYEAISKTIFQAFNGNSSGLSNPNNNLHSISSGNTDVRNTTFGLTMSSIAPESGGRVTNFAGYGSCWTGTNIEDDENSEWHHPLYEVTTASGPTNRDIAKYTTDAQDNRQRIEGQYYNCWPITSISGGRYFNTIGGYISNAVEGPGIITEGIIPRINLTLTYDTRITSTIARDVKFRMLEYDKYGVYQGPIDVTVTIATVIRNFGDIEAPVLAMYNEGTSNEYVRRVNIPASFLQRDIYLEDIKWEKNTNVIADDFHLQSMEESVEDITHFGIQVSPVEMVSNSLNNHMGWYDIVEENETIDVYSLAQDDLKRRTENALNDPPSVNYTSWNIYATSPKPTAPSPQYTITATANNNYWGTVTGGGTVDNGTSVTLTAEASQGYTFVNWSDGETTPSRSFTATVDASYIANFIPTTDPPATHTVTVTAGDGGSVTGGVISDGDHPWYKGSKVTVTATPNTGYHFVNWNGDENKTANPYTFTVGENDITLNATFAKNQYEVTAVANNSSGGNVSGGGTYEHGATATLTATANTGYEFVNWSDGETSPSRTYEVTADASFTANFRLTTNTTPLTVHATAVTALNGTTAGSVTVPAGTWYEGSKVDISATPATGFIFTHWSDGSTDNPHQITVGNSDFNIAASFVNESLEEHYDYDGTMPNYEHVVAHNDNTWGDDTKAEWYDDRISTTSLHGNKGIKLGTLDGRAPATLDVTLKYNGDLVYSNYFNEGLTSPLAWVYLKLHWYNTNVEDADGDDDGIFWVKVKLRTREKGDTIYMAPDLTLTRKTIEGHQETVHSWDNFDEYSTHENQPIENFANDIRNNPNMYVRTFPEALSIYEEGDVIDIMETIEVDNSDPITVGSNNYGGIQIIRYSGSHYRFPSLGCANPNTMVKVGNGGRLTFRNVQFNGSGVTRVKEPMTSSLHSVADSVNYIGDGIYYNSLADRVRAIYFADAPIIECVNGGQVTLSSNVSLLNNFNNYDNFNYYDANTTNRALGGAIAVTNHGILTMGNNTKIYNNMVVEHNTVDNFGGAIFVDGGVVHVGPLVDEGECNIDISHNYYFKGSGDNVNVTNLSTETSAPAGFAFETKKRFKSNETFQVYKLDTTLANAQYYSLSNVFLKREPSTLTESSFTNVTGTTPGEMESILKVRGDAKSDRIYFTGVLNEGSRIGVSKWFPGYRYTPANSSHPLYNTVPRDTILIAALSGSNKASIAKENFDNNIFFDDSNYFSQNSATRSFVLDGNLTTYNGNSSANPSYNDRVYTLYHNYIDEENIYLQRCASFGKGVTQKLVSYTTGSNETAVTLKCNDYVLGDSLAFRWNDSATCVAITDTLIFRVGGGFFPYTYQWNYDSVINFDAGTYNLYRKEVRSRETYDPNSISNFAVSSNAAKRASAQCDTLVLYDLEERPEANSTYFFQVTANDITGNCPVTQPIIMRVIKNSNANTYTDSDNFLLHGNSYAVKTPGVDSSGFHDHTGYVPTSSTRQNPSGSSLINTAYSVHDGSGWNTNGDASSYYSYNGDWVPRYMRTYASYLVNPIVMPANAATDIGVKVYSSMTSNTPLNVNTEFCPGSVVYLRPMAKSSAAQTDSNNKHWEYMSWDFDPSSGRNTNFVVGKSVEANQPTIYYAPGDYWWQWVHTYYNDNVDHDGPDGRIASRNDYETDYYGDVTIKTKKGLAWFISVVNGYNGQSARTFHFNTVTIAPSVSDNGLDMQAHKWTPVGNNNNPFEGTFIGNGKIVKNLIVNEESLPLVGMFGYTDSAIINNLTLETVQMKGNSYIGSLIGQSNRTTLNDLNVKNGILFSEYVVGGLVGKADPQSRFVNPEVSQNDHPLTVKGNAIYFGGIAGEASGTVVINPVVREIKQEYLSAYYSSPFFGTNVPANTNGGGNKPVLRSEVHNGYAHLKSVGNAERLGGLVGRAEALNLYNCYVYGEAKATDFTGALAGYVGSNVDISNCYYVDGLTNNVVGYGTTSAVQKSSSFHGRGKQVLLTNRVDGYNNLLRALNGWVNAQNNPVYKHWRPAVGDENGGYPLFGDPEMIEVFDTFNIATCDSYDLDGITLTQSGTYTMHFVDSTDYLDSTVTIMLTVNYGDTVEVVDTVMLGQGYEGYGISLTAEQVSAAFGNDHSVDIRAMMYIDSLLNANGCDSLVMLTLYIVNNSVGVDDNSQLSTLNSEVKIYPNPTRGMVNVEGDGLLSVEVYDNISRRVHTMTADGKQSLLRFDMSQQVAGSYYIRVKTIHGTVVKKLIKK